MKIGIGITTFNRPKTLKLALKYFSKNTPEFDGVEFVYHIQHFYPKKHSGIAHVKNLCLKTLMEKECDYIFLFDDDCFPCHSDWWKVFVEAHLNTGQHHLLFAIKSRYAKFTMQENGLNVFATAPGCCLFITRFAVFAIGGFDETLTTYGYEHEQYSLRVQKAGMNKMGAFLSPVGIENYIWSLDVQGGKRFASELGREYDQTLDRPKASIPLARMQESLKKNKILFEKSNQILIPLNYD